MIEHITKQAHHYSKRQPLRCLLMCGLGFLVSIFYAFYFYTRKLTDPLARLLLAIALATAFEEVTMDKVEIEGIVTDDT